MSLYDTLMSELAECELGVFNKAEQERRISICESCDKYVAESHKCGVCNCSTAVRVLFTVNSCPEGKWKGVKND